MSVGVALALVYGLLGQVVEKPDSLEVAFQRVQRRLTERALSGQVTALAHDRAVAVLINRVQETRDAIHEARQRQRDVVVERRALSRIRLEDLTETARARHLERLSQLDATLDGLQRDEDHCAGPSLRRSPSSKGASKARWTRSARRRRRAARRCPTGVQG
jgi:hypothetical protein